MSTTTTNAFPANFSSALRAKMVEAAREFDTNKSRNDDARWMNLGARQDSAESAFVARQLEFMRPGVYEVKYPDLIASSIMPFSYTVDTGAKQFTATLMDQAGQVLVGADMLTDVDYVEVKAAQGSMNLYGLYLGYRYTLQEMREAAFARVPLIPKKAMGAREQLERKLDDIAFVGDTQTGMQGLATASNTLSYSVSTAGAGGSTQFSAKDSDTILADLNGAVTDIITNSNGIEVPDTLLVPLSTYNLLATKRVGDGTSVSVKAWFMDNTPVIKTMAQSYKLESNTNWSGRLGIVYKNDPSKFEIVVSQPFEQLPPQYETMQVKTICQIRTGGIAMYLPQSVATLAGI
jgi:hypothetical protein